MDFHYTAPVGRRQAEDVRTTFTCQLPVGCDIKPSRVRIGASNLRLGIRGSGRLEEEA